MESFTTPSFHGEEGLVGGYKFQVGGGSHIVVSLECGQVALREFSCGLVELFAHLNTAILDTIIHLHFIQEPLSHDGQSIVWPALELVKHTIMYVTHVRKLLMATINCSNTY